MNKLEKRMLIWVFIVYLTPLPFGLWATHEYGGYGSIIVPIIMSLLMIPAYYRIKRIT